MIASRLLHHLLLSITLISGAASAVGLGEITLHSRIGEPLRAEVPVFAGGESLDPACFSLAPLPSADFPVISAGRTRLVRIGQDYRLIISGSKAVDEPVVAINVRAGCGLDLQREYVLLPGPPLAPVAAASDIEAPRMAAPAAPRDAPPYRPSLDERTSDNWSTEADTPVRPIAKPPATRNAARAVAKPKAPLPRDTLAGIGSGQDKIILGAALDDLPPPSAGDALAPANELNERVLKMETTLHLLNEEVDKLNTALTLGAESRAMREKLQDMQDRQSTPSIMPSVQAATPQAPVRGTSNHDGWIELLLGLLLGGSVSAGVAHLVSRRQNEQAFAAPPPRTSKPGKQRKQAKA